jgi:hypothetical protein
MPLEDAIAKLAGQIDATKRVEGFLLDPERVAQLRRQGAGDLYHLCSAFVSSVNDRLSQAVLELSPPVYATDGFREHGPNLFQIGSQGRQMQIAFAAPPQLSSTEKFMIPYVLEGEIRTYNQAMLERLDIRTRLIFFCVENERASWRHFDWRTRSTGLLSGEVLASLIEPLF